MARYNACRSWKKVYKSVSPSCRVFIYSIRIKGFVCCRYCKSFFSDFSLDEFYNILNNRKSSAAQHLANMADSTLCDNTTMCVLHSSCDLLLRLSLGTHFLWRGRKFLLVGEIFFLEIFLSIVLNSYYFYISFYFLIPIIS